MPADESVLFIIRYVDSMKRKFIFSLFLINICSLFGIVSGANVSVKGIVRSSNGEPIEFAAVYVKEAALGVITDENGAYSLNLPAGDYQFTITHLNYETTLLHVTVVAGQENVADV